MAAITGRTAIAFYKFHDPARFGGVKDPKLIEGVVKGSEEEKR
jgi:hypothetical protein